MDIIITFALLEGGRGLGGVNTKHKSVYFTLKSFNQAALFTYNCAV